MCEPICVVVVIIAVLEVRTYRGGLLLCTYIQNSTVFRVLRVLSALSHLSFYICIMCTIFLAHLLSTTVSPDLASFFVDMHTNESLRITSE
jgi:hypothetical protein